ncbi:MAG: hypothetical protein J6W86_07355 [Bacteroidales bacterium]|jgi:hypothetical protein|nr:hypothetical protein [Bacteroidales bacterium]
MNRKELIQRYLNAETSVEEEIMLAESFRQTPPQNEEEEKIEAMLLCLKDSAASDSSEDDRIAEEEFDRIVSKSGRRKGLVWAVSSAMAAAAVILLFLLLKPASPQPEDNTDLIQQIQHIHLLSQLSLEDADKCEFRPIEGGYVMTAYFPDGETASYILIAEEDGKTYSLLSLNQ